MSKDHLTAPPKEAEPPKKEGTKFGRSAFLTLTISIIAPPAQGATQSGAQPNQNAPNMTPRTLKFAIGLVNSRAVSLGMTEDYSITTLDSIFD